MNTFSLTKYYDFVLVLSLSYIHIQCCWIIWWLLLPLIFITSLGYCFFFSYWNTYFKSDFTVWHYRKSWNFQCLCLYPEIWIIIQMDILYYFKKLLNFYIIYYYKNIWHLVFIPTWEFASLSEWFLHTVIVFSILV